MVPPNKLPRRIELMVGAELGGGQWGGSIVPRKLVRSVKRGLIHSKAQDPMPSQRRLPPSLERPGPMKKSTQGGPESPTSVATTNLIRKLQRWRWQWESPTWWAPATSYRRNVACRNCVSTCRQRSNAGR